MIHHPSPKHPLSPLLAMVGFSQAELARRLGVHYVTVSKWSKHGCPGYVKAYIETLERCQRLTESLETQREANLSTVE